MFCPQQPQERPSVLHDLNFERAGLPQLPLQRLPANYPTDDNIAIVSVDGTEKYGIIKSQLPKQRGMIIEAHDLDVQFSCTEDEWYQLLFTIGTNSKFKFYLTQNSIKVIQNTEYVHLWFVSNTSTLEVYYYILQNKNLIELMSTINSMFKSL